MFPEFKFVFLSDVLCIMSMLVAKYWNTSLFYINELFSAKGKVPNLLLKAFFIFKKIHTYLQGLKIYLFPTLLSNEYELIFYPSDHFQNIVIILVKLFSSHKKEKRV